MQEIFSHINLTLPIAFAMTYLLHSTIWILMVGLLVRFSAFNSLSIKNYLWKAALVGGVLTSLFATIFKHDAFSITLPESQPTEITTDNKLEKASPILSTNNLKTSNTTSNINTDNNTIVKNKNTISNWFSLKNIFVLWAIGAIFLLLKLMIEHWIFFKKIKPREHIQKTSTLSLFYEIQNKANINDYVTLSQSTNLNSPILIGDSEICLPAKAVEDLEETQMEGMIAHELAHIARKDHYWTVGITLLNTILFFQPLHRWAIKEIKNTNELLCDAWAANLTGDNLALAKCLLTVAEWIKHKPYSHTLVAGMSLKKSDLSERIQSLINLPDLQKQRYDLAKTGLIFLSFLFFCLVIMPGFSLKKKVQELPLYQTVTLTELEDMHPKDKCNMLLQAVKNNNVKRVKELVKVIDPNCSYCSDGFPSSPFNAAANTGHTEIGIILLENDADIYYTAQGEGSAFYYAARNGEIEFMKLLKKQGANLNFSKEKYGTPLLAAVKHDKKLMVEYLLTNNANPLLEIDGFKSPVYYAKEKGKPMFDIFLKYKGCYGKF